jgi:serine/threonine protein kinase
MPITDPFVLAEDVQLLPVRELSHELRRGIPAAEDDFAITRPNARTSSKVIDSGAAELIRQFNKPRTIAQAVARFSRGRTESPDRLLEQAIPLLRSLISAGLLVSPDSAGRRKIQPSLTPGDAIDGWHIIRCVQTLEDTELYLARGLGGEFAALKVCRPGCSPSTRRMLMHEAWILSGLEENISPKLMKIDGASPQPWLAIEWFPGVDAQVACDDCGESDTSSLAGRVSLAGSILECYARLHEQGVIHGDVHPRNILVDRTQAVRIIDFGFGRRVTETGRSTPTDRAGVGFFFEPELARAFAEEAAPPQTSLAGEQYAAGALLYLLVTGSHYLDFSLERQEMMRQILDEPMVPFPRRGVTGWSGIEEVLRKALNKDPKERWASMRAFANAFQAASPTGAHEEAPPRSRPCTASELQLREMRTGLLQKIGFDGPILKGGPLEPPAASVNHGSAGIAYALYRMACASDDAELLALADVWSARSIREITIDEAFYNKDLDVTPDTVGRRSLFHSAAGVHAVAALIAQARGDAVSHAVAIDSFLAAASLPFDDPGLGLDVTLGRSGILLACSSLLGMNAGTNGIAQRLRVPGHEILDHIWNTLDGFAPIQESQELSLLGIAHGWAGLLYATLRWCRTTGDAFPSGLAERLDQLAACAEPAGRGLEWKWDLAYSASDSGGAPVPGWCNGSAGHVFLWTLAHRTFGEQRFLDLAEGAAWNAWERRHPMGNLCCGMAGQAYSLLNLYQHTHDTAWLRRARELTRLAAAAASEKPSQDAYSMLALRPESLYKGELGIIVLDSDLIQPDYARMPVFEAEN